MATAAPAVPPSARDGQRGGECLSHPAGRGAPSERVDPKAGALGAADSLPGVAGARFGTGGGGQGKG